MVVVVERVKSLGRLCYDSYQTWATCVRFRGFYALLSLNPRILFTLNSRLISKSFSDRSVGRLSRRLHRPLKRRCWVQIHPRGKSLRTFAFSIQITEMRVRCTFSPHQIVHLELQKACVFQARHRWCGRAIYRFAVFSSPPIPRRRHHFTRCLTDLRGRNATEGRTDYTCRPAAKPKDIVAFYYKACTVCYSGRWGYSTGLSSPNSSSRRETNVVREPEFVLAHKCVQTWHLRRGSPR